MKSALAPRNSARWQGRTPTTSPGSKAHNRLLDANAIGGIQESREGSLSLGYPSWGSKTLGQEATVGSASPFGLGGARRTLRWQVLQTRRAIQGKTVRFLVEAA